LPDQKGAVRGNIAHATKETIMSVDGVGNCGDRVKVQSAIFKKVVQRICLEGVPRLLLDRRRVDDHVNSPSAEVSSLLKSTGCSLPDNQASNIRVSKYFVQRKGSEIGGGIGI
jgi:hypothetical protein